MPANVPFLAKFALHLPKEKDKSNTDAALSKRGTLVTKVSRETTDDS